MEAPRPTRWRRHDARRRASIRRLLLAGGLVGLAGGIIAQGAVDHGTATSSEYEVLVRVALILPAVIFFLWWLLFPGIALEEPSVEATAPIDAEERLERIEAAFDSTAVPRARRSKFEQVNEDAHVVYRASIRRDPADSALTPESFGVRRNRVDDTSADTAS